MGRNIQNGIFFLHVHLLGILWSVLSLIGRQVIAQSYQDSVIWTKTRKNHRLRNEGQPPPYWPHYDGLRHVEVLNGAWNMGQIGTIDDPPTDFDSMDPTLDPNTIATVKASNIPSCVDAAPPGRLGYRGVTFYRTYLDYDELRYSGGRLQFQACSFYCRIWINGLEIGDHRGGGYVAFWLDIPPQPSPLKYHELFVLVDNRFNETTAPLHTGGDFWHYGGIMRSVEFHSVPSLPNNTINNVRKDEFMVWPWRLYIHPVSLSTIQLSLQLFHSMAERVRPPTVNSSIDLSLTFDGDASTTTYRTVQLGTAKSTWKDDDIIVDLGIVSVPNPRIWSTKDPQLHTLSVEVSGAIVTERFGLRQFGHDPKTSRFTLNGKIMKMVGWNHHTQWPITAASPTDEQMNDDMILLQEGGANFVRGAHYPQDPRWLDRLDEAGMIMWCETLGPEVSVKNAQDETFLMYQEQQIHEMIDNAFNHASIAMWGFFNEGPSDHDESCPAYHASSNVIRKRDSTRFITYASNKGIEDKCLDAATLISFNAYPGWYSSKEPGAYWDDLANYFHNRSDTSTKPFVISETGASGIFEWSENKTAERWTLAYQNNIVTSDVTTAIANENISGITIWHFFDFKGRDADSNNSFCDYVPDVYPPICAYINVSTSPHTRPGGLNHKGLIDHWRRIKPSYTSVAKLYLNATQSLPVSSVTDGTASK